MDFTARHAAIHFYGVLPAGIVLPNHHVSRSGPGPGHHAADHHKVGTERKGLDNITGISDSAVRHNGAVGPGTMADGCQIGDAETGLDSRGTNRTAADTHFNDIRTAGGKVIGTGISGDIPGHKTGLLAEHVSHFLEGSSHIPGVPVGNIHAKHAGTGIPQRLGANEIPFSTPDGDKHGVVAGLEHPDIVLDGHKPVQDPDSPFAADKIRHGLFGNGVHVCGHHRQVQR